MTEKDSDLAEAATRLAVAIQTARGARKGWSYLSPGEVSDLRRMETGNPPGAFWRLMVEYVPETLRAGDISERRWALVCQGMAWMAPDVHDSSISAGRALARTGFSGEERPIRINRLLRAEGDTFDDLFLSACRFLAAKAQPVDWRQFTAFALYRGDHQRKRLARDFYTSTVRAPKAA